MSPSETVRTRLIIGAVAGLVATAAMTASMRRMHQALPAAERYPLPPREINQVLFDAREPALRDLTLTTHFAFGAAVGATLTALRPRFSPAEGMLAGLAVWAASYFGWAPAMNILKSAQHHPARRNALMAGAHLVWGAVAAIAVHELRAARNTSFADGPAWDRS